MDGACGGRWTMDGAFGGRWTMDDRQWALTAEHPGPMANVISVMRSCR
ncbi:MAG: hypothetical protein ACJ78Q_14375 [Chloroflexia bacterium]